MLRRLWEPTATVQAGDERGVDRAVQAGDAVRRAGNFEGKTIRICCHLDLGWERKKTEVTARFSVLGRWEDGMTCLGGCYCFPVTRAAPASSPGGSADVPGVSGRVDRCWRDWGGLAGSALRAPRFFIFAESSRSFWWQSPAFKWNLSGTSI